MHRDGAQSYSVFMKIKMCTYNTNEIISVLIIVCIMRNNNSLLQCPCQCIERALRFCHPHVRFSLSLSAVSSLHIAKSQLQAVCLVHCFVLLAFFEGGKNRMDREYCKFQYCWGLYFGQGQESLPDIIIFFNTLLLLNC